MFPLPTFLKTNLLERLQTFATRGSVYAMQTLGVDAFREGNNIHLMNKPLNVQEACAGLRMLTIFIAIAVAMALIVNYRPWWQRLIIVVSAIPIALAVNVIRITVTGLLYNLDVPERIAHFFFHDLAGYFMMPLALVFLFLELKILDNLFIEVEEKSFVPSGISPAQQS